MPGETRAPAEVGGADAPADRSLLRAVARRLTRADPASVDEAVRRTLRDLVERLDGTRAFLYRFEGPALAASREVVWRRSDAPSVDLPVVGPEWFAPPLDGLLAGQPAIVGDVGLLPADHPVRARLRGIGDRAVAIVPVIVSGHLIASLGVTARTPRRWEDGALPLLEWCADALGATLSRVDLQRDATRREAFYREILDRMSEFVCRYDADGVYTFVNAAYAARHGRTPDDMAGEVLFDQLQDNYREVARRHVRDTFEHGRTSVELRPTTLDVQGTLGVVEWTDTPLLDDEGNVREVLAVGRDVTARERLADELAAAAATDELTGLANRPEVLRRLGERLATEAADLAVLFVDLDDFKVVNDSHGHALGDRVLAHVAQRLRNAARSEDLVARFGGDEFIVLAPDVASLDEALAIAGRLHDALAQPIRVGDVSVTIGASVGVALSEPDGSAPDDLVSDADAAMYMAKRRAGRHVAVADDRLGRRSAERARRRTALHEAVRSGRIAAHWQPVCDLERRVVGIEALLRWDDGGRLRQPQDFLEELQEGGLMLPVLNRTLQAAPAAATRVARALGHPVDAWVNVGPVELDDPGLPDRVAAAVRRMPRDARLLLELTERVIFEDCGADDRAAALARAGAGLALDDFGTGWSSLDVLRRLPLEVVKLDPSFVAGLPDDEVDRAACEAAAGLARALGFRLVAEGVERDAQLTALAELGVQRVQGWLLGRPLPLDELVDRLSAEQPVRG